MFRSGLRFDHLLASRHHGESPVDRLGPRDNSWSRMKRQIQFCWWFPIGNTNRSTSCHFKKWICWGWDQLLSTKIGLYLIVESSTDSRNAAPASFRIVLRGAILSTPNQRLILENQEETQPLDCWLSYPSERQRENSRYHCRATFRYQE